MYKELIITIIIIGLVIGIDVLTQRYTEACVENMNLQLENFKNNIINDAQYEITINEISRIENTWREMQNNLVYYIEHDELEKVTEQINEIRGYAEIDDIKESVPKIESCKFLLNHIKEKEAFNFKNIF